MWLNLKALGGLALLLAAQALALFLAAGGAGYWQAWVFLGVFGACTLTITVYLMIRNRPLLERRMQGGPVGEPRPRQKLLQAAAALAFVAVLGLSGFDHRAGWSAVPAALVVTGDGLVAAGFWVVFLVFRANSFASATVQVSAQQRVVSTGPYALVRHPMYAAACVQLVGAPLALGSWAALAAALPMGVLIPLRLLDEERLLAADLPGYLAYCAQVRWRLAPRVW